jgi:hypothetical protein
MRRHRLRWLLIFVVLLAVLFVAGNEVATAVAESQLASRARVATGAASASATVGPFPVLAYLFGQGRVPDVSVTLNDVSFAAIDAVVRGLPDLSAQRLVVDLHDVSVSRSGLVKHQDVEVTRIGSATATLTITAAGLSALTGLAVSLPGHGRVEVRLDGVTVTASLQIANGNTLVLRMGGRTVVSIRLRHGSILPACPMAVSFPRGLAVASCTMTPVPQSLVDALASAGSSLGP